MCFQDFQGLYDAITEWIPTQESKDSFLGKVSETIQYLQMIQEMSTSLTLHVMPNVFPYY